MSGEALAEIKLGFSRRAFRKSESLSFVTSSCTPGICMDTFESKFADIIDAHKNLFPSRLRLTGYKGLPTSGSQTDSKRYFITLYV